MKSDEVPADASAFIYLAKADAFDPAVFALGRLVAAPAVWREVVVDGRRMGYDDAERVEEAREEGLVTMVDLTNEQHAKARMLRARRPLGSGETETLALGMDGGRALIDDRVAGRVAEQIGVAPISTLLIPLLLVRAGRGRQEAMSLLERLALVMNVRSETAYRVAELIRRST